MHLGPEVRIRIGRCNNRRAAPLEEVRRRSLLPGLCETSRVERLLERARQFFGLQTELLANLLCSQPLGGLPQEAQDSLAASIPFPRRLGQADEFASLALHMIDNPYLNGEVVRLDAALRMAPR